MTFGVNLRGLCEAAVSLLYPPICQICTERRAAPQDGFVCPECRAGIEFVEPPFCQRCGLPFEGDITTTFECSNCRTLEFQFSSARSAVIFGEVVLAAIHRYKYNRALWFEPLLADLLIQRAAPVLQAGRWDWIVPVPLHKTKQREREFNQAEHLARRLSVATRVPLNTELLRRVRPTMTQTRLTRKMRAENMRGAFAWAGKAKLKGERIVVIDDVFTTGATTDACARVLRHAGAGEVCVWTVARGL